MDADATIFALEHIGNGILRINNSDRGILVHPNMPDWLLDRYIQLTLEREKRDHKLVFSLTDRCNIRCDFCCHPSQDTEFSDEETMRLTLEAVALPFREICLTGGEPLLKFDLVLKMAETCKRNNVLIGLITNGFWARTPGRAFDTAQALIEAGVGRVTFSWDPSHGKFISPDTISNGIQACMESGMKVTLTGSFKKEDDTHKNYGIDYEEYTKYTNFVCCNFNISPTGRALELDDFYKPPAKAGRRLQCPSARHGHDLVLYPRDGLAMPCCSVYSGYDLANMRIGDWRHQSIQELIDHQMSDGYYRLVCDRGFGHLREVLNDRAPELCAYLPDETTALSSCHYCREVMALPQAGKIREVCDAYLEQRLYQKLRQNSALIQKLLETLN